MAPTPKETKQQVRDYMQRRQQVRTPIPSRDEIRRQIGWNFVQPCSSICSR